MAVGDAVAADQNVMEIETDKTTVGVPAPVGGTIEAIFVKDGDTVKAGQDLFELKPGAGGAAPAPKPAAAAPSPPPPAAAAPPPKPAAAAPPRAAAAPPPPPPPKPAAPAKTAAPAAAPSIRLAPLAPADLNVKVPPADYSREITGTRTEQRVKMNRMRLKIASRLKEAQNTNAMLTTFNEIDMRYGIRVLGVGGGCRHIGLYVSIFHIFS